MIWGILSQTVLSILSGCANVAMILWCGLQGPPPFRSYLFMNERLWNRGLIATAAWVAIVSAISVWLAWNASPDLASRVSVAALTPIVAAAITSYSLRILRFHYFLSRSNIAITLPGTAVVQMVGFALSVTPGHVGEVFKLHLIRERAGTPVVQTAPLLLLDRLTEGGGFLLLATTASLMLPSQIKQTPVSVALVVGIGLVCMFALTRNHWFRYIASIRSLLLKWRWGRGVLPHLQSLWRGLNVSFTPRQILGGLLFSVLARFADGLVVLFAARVVGVDLTLPTAVFVLAVSGLAGGLSFLPAGTGAVETAMVGLLLALGSTLPNALAISLLARLATLWLWVALGLGIAFLLRWLDIHSRSREEDRL